MSRIWQICLREVRAYFVSPIAYIAMTAFLFLNGLIFWVILKRYSPLDMGPIASGYLYLFLVGAMFLALGLLVSILTRSQIVAAMISFVLMFVLFLVPVFFESLLSSSRFLQGLLAYMNTW